MDWALVLFIATALGVTAQSDTFRCTKAEYKCWEEKTPNKELIMEKDYYRPVVNSWENNPDWIEQQKRNLKTKN